VWYEAKKKEMGLGLVWRGKKWDNKLKDFSQQSLVSVGVNELTNRRDCADIRSFFGVCLIPGEGGYVS